MNVVLRLIYWIIIFMSVVSSLFYVSTTVIVKGDALNESNALIIENNAHITKSSDEPISNNNVIQVEDPLPKLETHHNDQKNDAVAEIHSSFDDAPSSSNSDTSAEETADHHKAPFISQVDISKKFSQTRQAAVFTLVDSASVELQQAVPISQQTESFHVRTVKNATLTPTLSNNPLKTDDTQNIIKIKSSAEPENISTEGDNKTKAKHEEHYIVRAEPKVVKKEPLLEEEDVEQNKDSNKIDLSPEESPVSNASFGEEIVTEKEISEHSATPEDIPSFSEWTQKQLAEAEEKQKVNNATPTPTSSSSRQVGALKLRSKNYASPDCGAKIVAANPEAVSAGSVLSPSRDEYVLNTCTSRIWFVVELCEAIQAKKIELANFELFSSTPREFSVSVSDRVQNRDWRSVGHFTAEDERTIQSFNLHPQLFGKYVKVEFHSHYGSEHFCPVSLFRVYGTSEFEVLETVDEAHESVLDIDDEDEDGALDIDTGEPPKNLFNSAKDAVMSIVKKAAEALVKGGDAENDTHLLNATSEKAVLEISHLKSCKSPRHIIVCDNCSDALFTSVYHLLSCQENHLQLLISSPFISDVIRDSQLCSKYGLQFPHKRLGAPYPLKLTDIGDRTRTDPSRYISAFFPPEYIAALCNMLAIFEKRIALNISEEPNVTAAVHIQMEQKNSPSYLDQGFENVVLPPVATCTIDNAATSQSCNTLEVQSQSNLELATSFPRTEMSASELTIASQINPTKTFTRKEEKQDQFAPPLDSSTPSGTPGVETESLYIQDANNLPAVLPTATSSDRNKTDISEFNIGTSKTTTENVIDTLGMESSVPKESEVSQSEASGGTGDATEEQPQDTLDTLLLDLKNLDQAVDSSSNVPSVPPTTVPPPSVIPTQQVQKESVFLRLANRIKALERNMSLSSQYLEELSRRYKKQMEEMQKAFNRTLTAVGEESRKSHEREQKRMEELLALQQQLATLSDTVQLLLSERDSLLYKAHVVFHHITLISVEVTLFLLMVYYCRRLPDPGNADEDRPKLSAGFRSKKNSKGGVKRRKSVEGVSGHESPRARHRRPSEEALNIAGSYHDLLISENTISEMDGGTCTVFKGESKRRRRKRKEMVLKSCSANIVSKTVDGRVAPVASTLSNEHSAPALQVGSSEIWSVSDRSGVHEEEKLGGDVLWKQEATPESLTSFNFSAGAEHTEELPISSRTLVSPSAGPSIEGDVCRKASRSSLGGDKNELWTKNLHSDVVPTCPNNGLLKSSAVTTGQWPLSPPQYIRTAAASRSSRHYGTTVEPSPQAKLKSDNWEWYSSHHNVVVEKSSQGIQSPSTSCNSGDQSGQWEVEEKRRTSNTSNISSSSDLPRKESSRKGSTGSLKKMVKKFF